MNLKKIVFGLLICIILGQFVLLFLDFAALHDINREYISSSILASLNVTLSKEVPDWTGNNGEWQYLNISLVMRFVSGLALAGIALYIRKSIGEG